MLITWFVVNLFLAYIYADFVMGVYHWIKDTYFTPTLPFFGPIFIWGSRLHHWRPRLVTDNTDMELFINSLVWTMVWGYPYFLIFPNILSVFFLFFIAINDINHKYAHLLEKERPYIITFLQKSKIMQSYAEHHEHHSGDHDNNYCPVTPFVNPLLEWINFWRNLENAIEKLTGVKPRAFDEKFIDDAEYPGGVKFVY